MSAQLTSQTTRPLPTRPSRVPATAAATTAPASTAPAAAPSAVATTAPTTAPVFPHADELLKALGSPDWHERRKTQELLVRGGEDARPMIEQLIRQATDEESRKNAEAALAQISQNKLTGTSYITLHVKNASPKDVFEQLSRQCFAPLLTWPDNLWDQGPWGKVTLDVDHKPFWEVVPAICQQLGIDFRPFQTGMRLMRSGGGQMQGISRVDGPFLVMANQLNYTRTRVFGAGQAEQDQFQLQLSIYPEPKLTVLHGGGAVNLETAVDDHGNSMIPQAAARNFFGGYMPFGGITLFAPLQYPKKDPGTRIVKLKGTTTLVIQTKVQKIEIANLMSMKETTKLVSGVQIKFRDMKKNNDSYELHLQVTQPNFGSMEWQQLVEGVQTRMQILDAEGNALDHRGMSTSGNNNTLDMTLEFARGARPDGRMSGEPAKLRWDVPVETKDITVPIDFHDLPMFD